MSLTYIQAIGLGFPGVQCHSTNDDTYENIVWDAGSPLPDKSTLDQWILANPVIIRDKKISVLAFRNRFNKMEKIKIDMASLDNPSLEVTDPRRFLAAAIRVSTKDADNALFIDLDDPDTRQGVVDLETYGLIDPGRSVDILDGEIIEEERYYSA